MPNILRTAYRNRKNGPPEFVTTSWVAKYLNMSVDKLKRTGILDGIPYRYTPHNYKEYRHAEVMDAISKYRVYPPDNLHPLHEFSQAEAMLELGMTPKTWQKFVKMGNIRLSESPRTGNMIVYRKDLDRFRREWDQEYLCSFIGKPVKRSVTAMLMGVQVRHLNKLTKAGRIRREPHKHRCPFKYSKAEILGYLHSRGTHVYRKSPLPDYLTPALARIYLGVTDSCFDNLKQMGMLKYAENPVGTGATRWCYLREDLEKLIEERELRKYYCEGLPYYNRRAIRYKFLKSERWIDDFVVGKCRRVLNIDEVVPATGKTKTSPKGWLKEDVEKVVASGVEVRVRKKQALARTRRRASSAYQMAMPPVQFSSPVEQMEAAIAASLQQGKEERKQKHLEIMRKRMEEASRLNAIRNILTTGSSVRKTRPNRNDILRFSVEPQVVTFLIHSSQGTPGIYESYPNAKEECLFRVSCGKKLGRRVIPPSFARAIKNALGMLRNTDVRTTPSWIVIAPATTMVTDPMFHHTLDSVPGNIGAVAPFGYGHMLPDGSWDKCPVSYGAYGWYGGVSREQQLRVTGITAATGFHQVEVMDGPFVAIRGIYVNELEYIDFFQQLGDQRGLLGPVMSALCRKFSIPMMQIPVECWGAIEYMVRPNTPEMNLGIDRIATFMKRSLDKIRQG